jgi:peroxin-3
MGIPSASTVGDGPQDGGQQAQKARKTKLQLWNDLKISGRVYTS